MASSRTVTNKIARIKEREERLKLVQEEPICAVIARVSLDRQSESVGHQVEMLKEFAKTRSYGRVLDEFIYEDMISASKFSVWERPGMKQLINDARAGKFQVVMFKGISRFARNTEEALSILDRLKAQGLRVISMEENYDSYKAEDSNFIFTIYAAAAEHESEKTSIRVRLGNKAKASAGQWNGAPPDGYALVDRRLVPNEDRVHIIKKIFDLYRKGEGSRKVADYLNKKGWLTSAGRLWCSKTVRDVLSNEVYLGITIYNRTTKRRVRDYDSGIEGKKKWITKINPESEWVIREGTHEPIISREDFEEVQIILRRRSFRKDAPNVYHPLTGILFCGSCGEGMVCQKRSTKTKEYRYYICKTYHKYGRDYCKQANINADDLERDVVEALEKRIADIYSHYTNPKIVKLNFNAARLDKEVSEVNRKIQINNKKTADLYFEKDRWTEEQYNAVVKLLKGESIQLLTKRQELESEILSMKNNEKHASKVIEYINDFCTFDRTDVAKLRRLIHFFVERIDITSSDITIKYRISF